jgi:hypothetical protein
MAGLNVHGGSVICPMAGLNVHGGSVICPMAGLLILTVVQ